ncbi:MAG: iron ABC transporter permease [Chitinivibrionia bacterium]|nr:iron ABC transporter permease [Chitinivibrionia bacterium]
MKKILFLFFLTIIIMFFSLFCGGYQISFSDFLAGKMSQTDLAVFWNFRFYRILSAALVGAILAMSGLTLQSLFANPLVEPYTLGISGGANLGVTIAAVVFGGVSVVIFGIFGAFCVSALLLFSAFLPNQSSNRILLTGITISYISAGISMLFLSFATSQDIQQVIRWGLGSVENADRQKVLFLTTIFALSFIVLSSKTMIMNVLQFGEDDAKNLGISVKKERIFLLVIASVLTASAVSLCGSIGFVGLLSPHIARKIFGEDNRILLFAATITGALLLSIADLLARTLFIPRELPAGVITGVLGGILFIYLLNKGESKC